MDNHSNDITTYKYSNVRVLHSSRLYNICLTYLNENINTQLLFRNTHKNFLLFKLLISTFLFHFADVINRKFQNLLALINRSSNLALFSLHSIVNYKK